MLVSNKPLRGLGSLVNSNTKTQIPKTYSSRNELAVILKKMKKAIIALVILVIFYSCKTYRKTIDNASRTFLIALIPDSCDMYLINEIKTFRIDNLKYPDNVDIEKLREKLNPPCQRSFSSIEDLVYNRDSIDFVFQKNFSDSTLKIKSMLKCYGVIFADDTLKELRILHNNTKYSSELLKQKR
jgi:hypothetical protein